MKSETDWEYADEMEIEEALEIATESFIKDTVTMIDGEYAQKFTNEDVKEVFRFLLSLE